MKTNGHINGLANGHAVIEKSPESKETKDGRGGSRPGSGRKPTRFKRIVRMYTAEAILSEINEIKVWKELLLSKNERVKISALMYLTDKRDGKARQPITGADGGAIKHEHEHFDLSQLGTGQLSSLEELIESATCESSTEREGRAVFP
jgi:hypothetical protein